MHTSARPATKHFDWNLVRSFLAVLEHGSLLGAARALQMSQPTLGRHVAALEKQWGLTLFERTGRGLLPTTAARRMAEQARAMETQALQLVHTLQTTQQQVQGSVRISASVPAAFGLLPPVLAQLREALPQVQVELVATNAVSNLLRREADIALRMLRPQQGSLVARKLGEVPLLACAHQRYLERHGTPQNPLELLQHALIGGDTDTAIERGFAAMGQTVPRTAFVLRCDDYLVQWQAVRAGLGIGFAAHYFVRTDPQVQPLLQGQLRVPALPVWLAVHREIRTSPRIRAVYDFLAQALPRALAG